MLRIGKLTDYAIVLLTRFATREAGTVLNARDLAEESHLPAPTVMKLLRTLARSGLLASHRGAKGGFSLARSPEAIAVIEVIEAVEGPIRLTECSSHAESTCELEGVCPVSGSWANLNVWIARALEGVTLADMSRPAGSVRTTALGIPLRVT